MKNFYRPTKIKIISVLCLFPYLLACNPSNADVIAKYKPEFENKRIILKQLAANIETIENLIPCQNIQPQIVFNEKSEQFNADFMMLENLVDSDEKADFDLLLGSGTLRTLRWTGDKNPLSESVLNKDGSNLEKDFVRVSAYRYLIVSRIMELKNPQVVSKEDYQRGKSELDTFVVDLQNNGKIICGFSSSAESLEDLKSVDIRKSYTIYTSKREYYRIGMKTYPKTVREEKRVNALPEIEQLQNAARSSLWQNQRKAVIDKLKTLTNAEIELKSD